MARELETVVPTVTDPYATPERIEMQLEARRFAHEEVIPLADELDKHKGEMPRSFIDRMGEQGYFGITVPKELGGMGGGVFEYCLISEELARGWLSVASIISRAQGAMGCNVADPERREHLTRMSAEGRWIGAFAASEPNAGSDLGGVETRVVEDGDNYVITGRKRWCGNALNSDFIQVLARLEEPKEGQSRSAGLISILVEKEPGAFPEGLTGSPIDKIGYHGFTTWALEFDGLVVPKANRVFPGGPGVALGADEQMGKATGGFKGIQTMLNAARVHTAARAIGVARAAVEDSIAYLQERHQFGRPIGDFQALRFMIADMAAQVDQARAYAQFIAHRLDSGDPSEKESAMVKYLATEMAANVTSMAMQLHGGNGYTTERRIERYWRDARLTTIFEGTSQIMQKIVSDRLLPRSPLA